MQRIEHLLPDEWLPASDDIVPHLNVSGEQYVIEYGALPPLSGEGTAPAELPGGLEGILDDTAVEHLWYRRIGGNKHDIVAIEPDLGPVGFFEHGSLLVVPAWRGFDVGSSLVLAAAEEGGAPLPFGGGVNPSGARVLEKAYAAAVGAALARDEPVEETVVREAQRLRPDLLETHGPDPTAPA